MPPSSFYMSIIPMNWIWLCLVSSICFLMTYVKSTELTPIITFKFTKKLELSKLGKHFQYANTNHYVMDSKPKFKM
jgi:hypothetical protein